MQKCQLSLAVCTVKSNPIGDWSSVLKLSVVKKNCPIPAPASHSWSRMMSTLLWTLCRTSSPWKAITFFLVAVRVAVRVATSAS